MEQFYGIMHISIGTDDIEATLDFYEKLGIKRMFGIEAAPGVRPWVYYFHIADGQYIEVVDRKAPNPYSPPGTRPPVYNNPERSLNHFGLFTRDLRAVYEDLTAKGITLYCRPTQRIVAENYNDFVVHADDGYEVLWVIDPNGNPIELMQPNRHPTQQEEADMKL